MSRFRCQSCGEYFGTRNVECPTEGCPGGMATYVKADDERPKRTGGSGGSGLSRSATRAAIPVALGTADASDRNRIVSGIGELDRVLGGGLVAGSLILLAGEPGAGKSTIALQAAGAVLAGGTDTLYISGEESAGQIRLRAERLGLDLGALRVVAETDAEIVLATLEAERPTVAIIDSVQTIGPDGGSAGSPAVVRDLTAALMRTAKTTGTALVLIGHVNKDSNVAGPKTLEHLVDAVLLLEGERSGSYRILRAVKNRFGATDEVGVFEMREQGLVGVPVPASNTAGGVGFGRLRCPVIEGSRPLLVEVQALVGKAGFANARRVAVGIAEKRLAMLLAALERYGGLDLSGHDVYVGVSAGITVAETAIDAAVLGAIASSYWSTPIAEGTVAFGEVGLSGGLGVVRAVGPRLREAARAGAASAVGPPRSDADPLPLAYREAVDVRGLLAGLGVLAPPGAAPAPGRPAGGQNGAPWMWGGRKARDEEDE